MTQIILDILFEGLIGGGGEAQEGRWGEYLVS